MTYDEYLKQQQKQYTNAATQKYNTQSAQNQKVTQQAIDVYNSGVDASTKLATDKLERDIEVIPQDYQSSLDTNYLQQKINERQLAERMENLGLTDSGLNRTQMTAIVTQRMNADQEVERQKNAAIRSIKNQINDLQAEAKIKKDDYAAQQQLQLTQTNNSLYNTLMSNAESQAISDANAWQKQQIEAENERTAVIEKQKKQDVTDITKLWKAGDYEAANNKLANFASYYNISGDVLAEILADYGMDWDTIEALGKYNDQAVENDETRTELKQFDLVNEIFDHRNWAVQGNNIWFAGTKRAYTRKEFYDVLVQHFKYDHATANRAVDNMFARVHMFNGK